jgi:hypothetical protein
MSYPVEMIRVNSSVIRAVGYDSGTLVVEFHSGRSYEYHGVPSSVYEALQHASSVGAYYNQNIRGSYS